jgi:hypothetical protein
MSTRQAQDDGSHSDAKTAHHALVVSIVSLGLATLTSLGVAFLPFMWSTLSQTNIANNYAKHLVLPGYRTTYLSAGLAEKDSPAAQFADAVRVVRENLEGPNGSSRVRSDPGTVSGAVDGIHACFHLPDVFAKCVILANFEFDTNNRVTRFTIDGIPVEQLFRAPENDTASTRTDDTGAFRAYRTVRIFDTDFKRKVLIYELDRTGGSDDTKPLYYDAKSTRVQDVGETPILADRYTARVPDSLLQFERPYAMFSVPYSTEFILICWNHSPVDTSQCEWIYDQ